MEQEDSNAGGNLHPNHFVLVCKVNREKRQHANPDLSRGGVTRSSASAGKKCRIRSDNVLWKRQNEEAFNDSQCAESDQRRQFAVPSHRRRFSFSPPGGVSVNPAIFDAADSAFVNKNCAS